MKNRILFIALMFAVGTNALVCMEPKAKNNKIESKDIFVKSLLFGGAFIAGCLSSNKYALGQLTKNNFVKLIKGPVTGGVYITGLVGVLLYSCRCHHNACCK